MSRRTERARRRLPWALLLIVCAGPLAALEPLEQFPRLALEIRGPGGRQWFDVAIADSAARSEQGLMFVRTMPPDAGMLFPQRSPQVMSMWMKNTLIPLDMLFIDTRGRIVCLLERVPPLTFDIRSCAKPVKAVVEINGGEAERRGIRQGDRVYYTLPPADASKQQIGH